MKKLTLDQVQKRIDDTTNNAFTILGDFKRVKSPAHVRCNHCGNDYYVSPFTLYNGTKCPYCERRRTLTIDEYRARLRKEVGNEYSLIGKYSKSHDKALFKHNKCGTIFEMSPHAFDQGQRCPNEKYKRSAKANGFSIDKVKEKIKVQTNGEYEIVSGFTFSSKKCQIRHMKCNRIFRASPSSIYSKASGCPYCYSSKGEDAVRSYLFKRGLNFKEQYKIPECKNIRPLPFDFAVLNSDNEVIYLVEYQGEQHYKPKFGKDNFIKTQQRDKIKFDFCKKNDISLIRIPYKRLYSYSKLEIYVFEFLDKYIITSRPSQAV